MDSDTLLLYSIATADEISYRWRFRGPLPSFEAFRRSLEEGVFSQAIAVDANDNSVVAHVSLYNADIRSGIAFLSTVVAPGFVGSRRGALAATLFAEQQLARWPFRKLYVEIPEFTFEAIEEHMAGAVGSLLHEEARLRQFTYFAGRYWDMIILGGDSESWLALGRQARAQ